MPGDQLNDAKLPNICFATYAPLRDVDRVKLPDLDEFEDCIEVGDGNLDQGMKCDLTQEQIKGVRYFATFKCKEGAASETLNFSEKAALSGQYPARSFTPTIYYRITGTFKKKKMKVGGVKILG